MGSPGIADEPCNVPQPLNGSGFNDHAGSDSVSYRALDFECCPHKKLPCSTTHTKKSLQQGTFEDVELQRAACQEDGLRGFRKGFLTSRLLRGSGLWFEYYGSKPDPSVLSLQNVDKGPHLPNRPETRTQTPKQFQGSGFRMPFQCCSQKIKPTTMKIGADRAAATPSLRAMASRENSFPNLP